MTRTLIVLPFGILGGAFLGLMLGAYWVTIELGSVPRSKLAIAVLLLGWRAWSWRSRDELVP